MIEILFIRHGATEGNLKKKYIGITDEPLCSDGISQIIKLKDKNLKADYIFVSPLIRTKQTAKILFPDVDYTIIKDFAETNFGQFEGKTAHELSKNENYINWVNSGCKDKIPDGDDIFSFKEKCQKAFFKILKSIPNNSKVAFVIHGGVIMAIMEKYLKPKGNFYDYNIGNGEYILCEYKNGNLKKIQ